MSRPILPTVLGLCLALTIAPGAVTAQEQEQTAPAAETAGQDAPVQPTEAELEVTPAPSVPSVGVAGFGRQIEDIDLHRIDRAPYVRRKADIVEVDLDGIDLEADVVMTVDGEPVTRSDYRKRAIMYFAVNKVDEAITKIVTESQREKQIAAGVDPATIEVQPEDLDEKIEALIAMVEMQAAGPNAGADEAAAAAARAKAREDFLASIEASMGMEAYREMLSAEVAFEKVFLPMPGEATGEEVWDLEDGPLPEDDPKPDWMPQVTWDALGANESGKQLRYFVKRQASEGEAIPSFFRSQITSSIRLGVIELLGVQFFFDAELPDDVFLRLGDVDLKVDDLWGAVADEITPLDEELILRELLTLRGMRSTLSAIDEWMTDEQAAEAFAELEAQYEGTLFPLGSIIVLRGYRSVDRYREHWRYRETYNRWRKQSLTEEEIEDHYRTAGRLFFERGNVEVDLAYKGIDAALFGQESFDESTASLESAFAAFLDDGDEEAEGEEAEAEGPGEAEWRAISAGFPRPLTRQTQNMTNPDADRYFQRNPLRIRLTESEMSILITGYSMADDIFYHGVPGEVFGPTEQPVRRHAWGAEVNAGVWMGRVAGYTRDRPLAPMQGRDKDQAYEDYLDLNFFWWSQECLKSLLPKVEITKVAKDG